MYFVMFSPRILFVDYQMPLQYKENEILLIDFWQL